MISMTVSPELSPSRSDADRLVFKGVDAGRELELLVREEPLEIRVNGGPVAVLMRTPGADEDLVRGYLLTQGIVSQPEDIQSLRPYPDVPRPRAVGSIMLAVLHSRVSFDLARHRHGASDASCCGVCGTDTVQTALRAAVPFGEDAVGSRIVMPSLSALLKTHPLFGRVEGLHLAGALAADGSLLALREDVARHNAVDKVIGAVCASEQDPAILAISGRVSCEVIQKALAARIPAVASVSVPSAMAVDLARASNMTLVSSDGTKRMVIYTDPGRLADAAPQEASRMVHEQPGIAEAYSERPPLEVDPSAFR